MQLNWLGILKSTRVQAGIAAIAFVAFGDRLGFSEDQALMVVSVICTIIVGRSLRPPVIE